MATYKKQLKDQNGDNIIPALGTATVTSTNIDWSTMPFELVFDTTIGANSSSSATIDIPIDLVTYRKLTIDFTYEANSGSSAWMTAKVLDGSKSVLNVHQIGIEYSDSTTSTINRNGDQIIAWGYGRNAISHASIELSRADIGNYPAFVADGYGGMTGSNTSDVKCQKFSGRVQYQAQYVKYIRFAIPYAKAGGHIIVYGIR
jgi:hypothetical protein